MSSREELLKKGYICYCISCMTIYHKLPTVVHEDGHGGHQQPMCKCGCDLFADLKTDQLVEKEVV